MKTTPLFATDRSAKHRVPNVVLVVAAFLGIATLIRFRIHGLGPAGIVLAAAVPELFCRLRASLAERTHEDEGPREGYGVPFAIVWMLGAGSALCVFLWIGIALGWAD